MVANNKEYLIKFYEYPGALTLKKTIHSNLLRSKIKFTSRINGAQGELNLRLALPFDEFIIGGELDHGDIVRVYSYDSYNPSGKLIYSGWLSSLNPYVKGADNGVDVVCLGLGSYLSKTRYDAHIDALTPGNAMKVLLDDFESKNPGLINYTASSIVITGDAQDYKVAYKQSRDAIQQVFQQGGSGDFWHFVDQNGTFKYQQKPSTPSHTFTLEKNAINFSSDISNEDIINDILIEYASGNQIKSGIDSASIALYGRRQKHINLGTNNDINAVDSAIAKSLEKATPLFKAKFTIIKDEYDIDSIEIGQTCQVRNIKNSQSLLPDNTQIVALNYQGDSVTIECDEFNSNFGVELGRYVDSQ